MDVRYLKGPRPDPLVAEIAAVATSDDAQRLTRVAGTDMAQLVTRLGEQPTDPAPLLSTAFATEAEAVAQCATPPAGGALLYAVVQAVKPRKVLEIGTAHGYGAYYIASALKSQGDGRLYTLEGMRVRVSLARETIDRLGVADAVELVEGNFRESVPRVLRDGDPVDLVFSDGDKSPELTRSQFEECIAAMPHAGALFFDDISHTPEIERLFAGFVAHPRVERAASFRGRWALLQLGVTGGR